MPRDLTRSKCLALDFSRGIDSGSISFKFAYLTNEVLNFPMTVENSH